VLYGSETWTVTARDGRRITAAEMKYMRITAGYTLDRLQNKYEGWNFNSGNYLFTTDTK